MDKRICVVGMGQGGMVAAYFLAKEGYQVDIYEKATKDSVGHFWKDDIRMDIFSIVDLPNPNEDIYCQKGKWVFLSPSQEYRIKVPPCKPMEEISIDRRGLSNYFYESCCSVGCTFHFGQEINQLVEENGRIIGVVVDGKEFYYNLVIDASGMNSPLRGQIDDKYHIQRVSERDGVLKAYRAFFRRNENSNTVEKDVECTMVIKHLGKNGISWCNINDEGEVDVLVARVGELTDQDIEEAVSDLREKNGILSTELIRDKKVDICLRCGIANSVADGYVAIGDSAFMTMPLMGSGIESSMKAGKLFADYVIDNAILDFSIENLWGYWIKYMRGQGKDYIFIDVLKRWALSDSLDPSDIDWVFGGGLIEEEDMALISTDIEGEKPRIKFRSIFKKIFLLLGKFGLVCKIIGCIIKAINAKNVARKIPSSYEPKAVRKWIEKYNSAYIIE